MGTVRVREALVEGSEGFCNKVTLEPYLKDKLTTQKGEGVNEGLRVSPFLIIPQARNG